MRRWDRGGLSAYRPDSGGGAAVGGAAVLVGALALLSLPAVDALFVAEIRTALVFLGVIGMWRYSWAALHFVRAAWYRRVVFPRIRRDADARARLPAHLYVVVTSYRMSAEMNVAVYGRLLREIAACGVDATVVACITDPADLAVLRRVARSVPSAARVEILGVFQSGRGKRDAMADALERIAGLSPPADAQVVLMDGDSLLDDGALWRAVSVLSARPEVGGVTTENSPLVDGTVLAREWYRLRMTQRSTLMCSLSLSGKVLVLTGRFSVLRAEIVMRPGFAAAVRSDVVHHWRLGEIPLLTGDDKTTWFEVLRQGWGMLFVPDAVVRSLEKLPPGGFVPAGLSLMSRWFGNMVRGNGRAVALGPRRTGLFTWLCLLDQRVSMWTPLVAPVVVTVGAVEHGAGLFALYGVWVLATRTGYTLALAVEAGRWHPLFPILLYYNQIVGSVVKIFVSFHPYRQRWTRQALGPGAGRRATPSAVIMSHVQEIVMVAAFVSLVAAAAVGFQG